MRFPGLLTINDRGPFNFFLGRAGQKHNLGQTVNQIRYNDD